MIAVIDYCAGNLHSVARALDHLGLKNFLVTKPDELKKATAVIVPGVGSAGAAMQKLRANKLDQALLDFIKSGKLYLGICLGLQILFESSEEGKTKCLGVLKGTVNRFTAAPRVPQIGWNQVKFTPHLAKNAKAKQLFAGVPNETNFYHLHSYIAAPSDKKIVVAETEHGEIFPAAIVQNNIIATQFHPEKSGEWGLKVLENFGKILKS